MATSSIYQKFCPSCATQVSVDASQCTCGYSFVTTEDEVALTPDEQHAQRELFAEYVQARVTQALASLENLQALLQADPRNLDKANQLMQAYAEVRELRAELADHEARQNTAAVPASTPDPSEAFRAAQAAKAEKVMQAAGINTKDCPRCHAVLPAAAALCFCGFAFSPTEDARRADDDAITAPPR